MSQESKPLVTALPIKADEKKILSSFPKEVVIIPIVNSPIFPGMIAPVILADEKYSNSMDSLVKADGLVALNLVKAEFHNDGNVDVGEDLDLSGNIEIEEEGKKEISSKDIYRVGILCKIVKKIRLPDGSVNILVHGVKRYRAEKLFQDNNGVIKATPEVFDDIVEMDDELDAYTRSIINQVKKLADLNPFINEEMKLAMINSPSPGGLADLVAFSLSLEVTEAQDFIETLAVKKRFAKLLVYLKREKDVAEIQKKISDEVNDKVNKYQKEYFLKEQLKVIRHELGMDEDDKSKDLNKLREKLEGLDLPEVVTKTVKEEIHRLETVSESSPEYNVIRTYLSWIADLPWNIKTEDSLDIEKAKKILEKDHYGLEKVKERILEFLAVRALTPNYSGSIICLVGPPGVGKTSLGKSIAKAMGRNFYRFSLGGMRDEAEIKGHRRTYVGAMPGKIIQSLKRVASNNPVIMLDEIDKLGASFQGDPATALLEVLDPEQNKTFIDHYLDIPFDLSNVLFMATANYLEDIPAPLLDRMELIELSGYTLEEKISIAKKWIIPKQLAKHGLFSKDLILSQEAIKKLIFDYAREPGVRIMEQCIAKLCRRAAFAKVTAAGTAISRTTEKKAVKGQKKNKGNEKGTSLNGLAPSAKELEAILGPARFQSDVREKALRPGVVTGLAWTAFGGDILFIETLPLKGKGGFKLTGQLGEVMNESANLAYSYVKKVLQEEIEHRQEEEKKVSKKNKKDSEDYLAEHEVHLHLPAGATPKDGPSAGITMACALYGLSKNLKIRSQLAMTGELSLTGKVLPVGGIKEKVLAAKRAGIKEIIIPKENEKDLKEVPERHRKGLKFYPVKYIDEVFTITFANGNNKELGKKKEK